MSDIVELKKLSHNLSIIYVEDEELLRDTLVKYLEKIFDKVDYASNGEEGLEKYKKTTMI